MQTNIQSTLSTKANIAEAVKELTADFKHDNTACVLYFASPTYEQTDFAKTFQSVMGKVPVFGCSTSGEIGCGKMLKDSAVAMAFPKNIVTDCCIVTVNNIKTSCNVDKAFATLEEHFKAKAMDWDPSMYVGIILVDGLTGAEEKLMDKIGDRTNIFFVGGSAGDNLKFAQTHVHASGISQNNAAVLAVFKVNKPFEIIKTQSFIELNRKLTATKVDEANRTVLEFNQKPAVQAYAEAVGCPPEKIADYFMHNPVGLMINNEPYVRSPQRVVDKGMVFYCGIKEGMEVSLLESTDIIKDTTSALEDFRKKYGKISGVVNFHCILRTLELEQKCLTGLYGEVFKNDQMIGFSTYGEEFMGHINQTSTMLVFS